MKAEGEFTLEAMMPRGREILSNLLCSDSPEKDTCESHPVASKCLYIIPLKVVIPDS